MTELVRDIFLGFIQGLTEFLPVSSSGHLAVIMHLMKMDEKSMLPLIVSLHLATTLAVVIYFRRDLAAIVGGFLRPGGTGSLEHRRLAWMVVAGTIPTAVIALSFKSFFERLFNSPRSIAVGLVITGLVLWFSERLALARDERAALTLPRALAVGLAQGIAVAPGISRTGATIGAGLSLGLKRKTAFRFSFLLAIPSVLGAQLIEARHLGASYFGDILSVMAGMVAAFLAGYAALAILSRWLGQGRLHWFSYYCWLAAAAILIWV